MCLLNVAHETNLSESGSSLTMHNYLSAMKPGSEEGIWIVAVSKQECDIGNCRTCTRWGCMEQPRLSQHRLSITSLQEEDILRWLIR